MALNGLTRTASISACGRYRWTLSRTWDASLPTLLVTMFNPSDANHEIDDPTITILCHIAAHNGFGGIVVVNGIPLRSSAPGAAAEFCRRVAAGLDPSGAAAMLSNLDVLRREIGRAGAALLAWGALAERCQWVFDGLLADLMPALPDGVPLLCLGKTAGGHPKHPMARGRHKVPRDAKLLPWEAQ